MKIFLKKGRITGLASTNKALSDFVIPRILNSQDVKSRLHICNTDVSPKDSVKIVNYDLQNHDIVVVANLQDYASEAVRTFVDSVIVPSDSVLVLCLRMWHENCKWVNGWESRLVRDQSSLPCRMYELYEILSSKKKDEFYKIAPLKSKTHQCSQFSVGKELELFEDTNWFEIV